ncbi:MAG: hypothetical protein H6815_07065 [Phycisphaeraceae bacterium]|nr:hypothetical protein [Phycisphaerales bacterium]MCB9860200.1 hypothetical protein [Phycisphaeraceae bacterium]
MGRKTPQPLFELLRERERASLGANQPPAQTPSKVSIDREALSRPTKAQLKEAQRQHAAREISPDNPIRVVPKNPQNLPSGEVLAKMARGATVVPGSHDGHTQSNGGNNKPAPKPQGPSIFAKIKDLGASAKPQIHATKHAGQRQHVVAIPMTAVYVGLPLLILGLLGAYSIGHMVGKSEAEKTLAPYAAVNTTTEQFASRNTPAKPESLFEERLDDRTPFTQPKESDETIRIADGGDTGGTVLPPHNFQRESTPTRENAVPERGINPSPAQPETTKPSENQPKPAEQQPIAPQAPKHDVLKDTRITGLNYLRIVSSLTRDDAVAAAEFLTTNGVPAFAAVDPDHARGNNASSWCVRTSKGFAGAPHWQESEQERRELKRRVAAIGQNWQQNHRGVSDFSQPFYEKKIN